MGGEERPTVEERAQVNQRALIDKVLARYSEEFTLFRELLQNADDAGPFDAKTQGLNAEIRFKTAPLEQCPLHEGDYHPGIASDTKTTKKIVQWTIRNDGKPFDDGDWRRLPMIAEGNPNSEKVGAFGVGFYSVFSVTDSPSISSGGKASRKLRFHWKENDNQLYTLRSDFRQDDHPWTTFELPLREPRPMLSLLDLMRFLTSSITFMVNLTAISVFVDEDRVGYIQKSRLSNPRTINIPEEMKRWSDKEVMHVEEVESRRIRIEAEMKNAKSQVDLTIFTAKVGVRAKDKLSDGIRRSTKKKPPSRVEYSLIYTGKDEYDRNSAGRQNKHPEGEDIFQGLHADFERNKHTRIFIGHATGQTTGIGGHMSSRFIPTVERESIDFVDECVSTWNEELLYVGGFLCRVVYEEEISGIEGLWEEALKSTGSEQSQSRDDLNRGFLHVLKFFAFHDSTPSSKVAQVLHQTFYSCFHPLRILSSVGVREAAIVKTFDIRVAEFLDSIPMLSSLVAQEATRNIKRLPDSYKILPVIVEDVLQALYGHPLSIEKLCLCLRWWLDMKRSGPSLSATDFLEVVSFTAPGGIVRPLSEIRHFLDNIGLGVHIPRDGPLPTSLVPVSVSERFNRTDLAKFEWRELTIMEWFRHISLREVRLNYPKYDFTNSLEWAGRVLYTLSRGWLSLPEKERLSVKAALEEAPSIPTRQATTGSFALRFPKDTHLPVKDATVHRECDLSLVAIELDREITALLSFIGVRQNISEDQAYKMLEKNVWSMSEFIDYYLVPASRSSDAQEFSNLTSKLFPDEASGEFSHLLKELYPPVDTFRQLELPVIKWDKNRRWLEDSEEAKILYRLGLKSHPPLEKLIDLCTSLTTSIREAAFTYLCSNIQSKYSNYREKDFSMVPFVPAENKEGTYLKNPSEVFLGDQWKAFGFFVVRDAYQNMNVNALGVRKDPSPLEIIPVLEKTPPRDEEEACEWFKCLSDYQAFEKFDFEKLSRLKIVPKKIYNSQEWFAPVDCYLGQPMNEFYSKLFLFVDFGSKAKPFLSTCGSKEEPSPKDVAERLIDDPKKFHELAGTHESFLDKLRDLANKKSHIPNKTLYEMSHQRTLLGKRLRRTNDKGEREPVFELRVPKEIVIIDDPRDYELFCDVVYVAPPDESLERFYNFLGCRRLSTVIQEQYEDSPATRDDQRCSKIQELVLLRLPLFLRRCSHSQYNQAHMPAAGNFRVFACQRIRVHKTLMIGNDKQSRKQDLWAVARCNEEKIIELWISNHVRSDMYDLAASLCRVLFGTVRFPDIALLAAMLSDLKLLKRAGFDVEEFDEKPSDPPVDTTPGSAVVIHDSHSSASPPPNQEHYQIISIVERIGKAGSRAYHMVKGKVMSNQCSSMTPERRNISRQHLSRNCIQNIVKKAVDGCNSERQELLSDEEMIKFLTHYSCYDFVQIDNLRLLGVTPEGVAIHVTGDDLNVCAFIAGKQDLLYRFISVVMPAAASHKLAMTSLHIFYEVSGPIAFNSDGNIYLNLRYFEDWHDKDVQNNDTRRATLSWFFVLAHEVAHSLIPSHDSAHAFWFSAFCENHIDSLLDQLKPKVLEERVEMKPTVPSMQLNV